MASSHSLVSQLWPGWVHVPQLALQHTWPVLQVFGPHGTLSSNGLMPHTACEHFCPGSAHVPQLALQHTLPSVQTALPQGSSTRETGLAGAAGPALFGGLTVGAGVVAGEGAGSTAGAAGPAGAVGGAVSATLIEISIGGRL